MPLSFTNRNIRAHTTGPSSICGWAPVMLSLFSRRVIFLTSRLADYSSPSRRLIQSYPFGPLVKVPKSWWLLAVSIRGYQLNPPMPEEDLVLNYWWWDIYSDPLSFTDRNRWPPPPLLVPVAPIIELQLKPQSLREEFLSLARFSFTCPIHLHSPWQVVHPYQETSYNLGLSGLSLEALRDLTVPPWQQKIRYQYVSPSTQGNSTLPQETGSKDFPAALCLAAGTAESHLVPARSMSEHELSPETSHLSGDLSQFCPQWTLTKTPGGIDCLFTHSGRDPRALGKDLAAVLTTYSRNSSPQPLLPTLLPLLGFPVILLGGLITHSHHKISSSLPFSGLLTRVPERFGHTHSSRRHSNWTL
jgi:hypothetical protein